MNIADEISKTENVNAWARFIEKVGVPVFLLVTVVIAMSFAGYKATTWVADRILIPTFEANQVLVATQIKNNETLQESLKALTVAAEAQQKSWQELLSEMNSIRVAAEASRENNVILKELLKRSETEK